MLTKEWIEVVLRERLLGCELWFEVRISDTVETIAQAAEQDRLTDQLKMAALASEASQLQADADRLRAQVAGLAGALDGLSKAVWYGTDDDRQRAYDKAQLALSTAPQVLTRFPAVVRVDTYHNETVFEFSEGEITIDDAAVPAEYDEAQVEFIVVLSHEQESEQDPADAQG
jgi:hypothetical protein